MTKTAKTKKRYINDLILVGAIAVIALIAFGAFLLTMKEGAKVTVSINGVDSYTYSLDDRLETDITVGDQSNRLVIKDGEAYIESATCPDKICVAHRPISKDGETIVCLPNKVVVAVTAQ